MLENMQKSQEGNTPDLSKLSLQENEENKEKEEPKKEEPEQLTEEEMAERVMQEKLRNRVDIPLEQCLFCEHNKHFKDVEENLEHMFRTHGFLYPRTEISSRQDRLGKIHVGEDWSWEHLYCL